MFILIPVILSFLIILLIVKLKSKQKTIEAAGIQNLFGKEVRSLLLILALFDSSFILRYLFDTFLYPYIWYDVFDLNYEICTDSHG